MGRKTHVRMLLLGNNFSTLSSRCQLRVCSAVFILGSRLVDSISSTGFKAPCHS